MADLNFFSVCVSSAWRCLSCIVLISLGVSACGDGYSPDNNHVAHHAHDTLSSSQQSYASPSDERGNKLVDVAGQATLPAEMPHNVMAETLPSPQALKYVGGYHVHIPCTDPIAFCKGSDGEIDYVLSLLSDGRAYRQRISIGRIRIDDRQNTKIYEPDHWELLQSSNEIEISLFGGGKLYFHILDSTHLKANVDKIAHYDNGKNLKDLGDDFVLPHPSRILTKFP